MAQDDIQGQVVDPSGNPVSGAIVELTKSFESNPVEEQTVLRTTTDSNGNYIFEFHPDGDGTTQDYHVSCYNHDGTAYVNSFNNPGVTADLPSNAIPDSDVYLHDDWDDNKIQNRDGSGTTTYNGVTGYYRPEWTVLRDSPSASNQILVLDAGDAVSTDINLDLATDVTWTYTDFSVNGDLFGGWHVLSLYSQTQTLDDYYVYEGYQVALRESNDSFLFKVGSGGSLTQVLSWSSLGSGVFDVTVNRSSGGQWEVFVDGNSKGTATDTEFTNPQYTSVVARSQSQANIELNEMKVN